MFWGLGLKGIYRALRLGLWRMVCFQALGRGLRVPRLGSGLYKVFYGIYRDVGLKFRFNWVSAWGSRFGVQDLQGKI